MSSLYMQQLILGNLWIRLLEGILLLPVLFVEDYFTTVYFSSIFVLSLLAGLLMHVSMRVLHNIDSSSYAIASSVALSLAS